MAGLTLRRLTLGAMNTQAGVVEGFKKQSSEKCYTDRMNKTRWITQLRMGYRPITLKSVMEGLMLPEEQVAIEQALQTHNAHPLQIIELIRMPLARVDARIVSNDQFEVVGRDVALMALHADMLKKREGKLFGAVVEWGRLPLDHHEYGYEAPLTYALLDEFDPSLVGNKRGEKADRFNAMRSSILHLGMDLNACPLEGVSPLALMLLHEKQWNDNPLLWPETQDLVGWLVENGARIVHRGNPNKAHEALALFEKAGQIEPQMRELHTLLAQGLASCEARILDENTDPASSMRGPSRRM